MTRPDLTIVPPADYDLRPNLYDGPWAMPTARAATPSGLSRFAASCKHHIAIASVALCIFCFVYFGLQLLRGWVS